MTIHAFQPASPLAGDGVALARALARAGVHKQAQIRVTGSAALTAVIWLMQRGYGGALMSAPGATRYGQAADALLVPGACTPAELKSILRSEWLRPGGALIVQTAGAVADGGSGDVRLILAEAGYLVQHRLTEKGREVWIARRAGSGDVEKAA